MQKNLSLYIVNDYIICLSPISLMEVCPECSSPETVFGNDGLPYCAFCGINILSIVYEDPVNYTKQQEDQKVKDDYKKVSPRLKKALFFDKRDKNKKSRPHKEGLIEIENYQNYFFSGKKDISENGKFPIIKEAISLFEQGIKMQTKEVRRTNQKSMFMPSGQKNASLFASYGSLMYSQRKITGDWNSGLKKLSEHIHHHIGPTNHSGEKLNLNEIQSQLSKSYKRLVMLVPPSRGITNRTNKLGIFNKNFSNILSQYTQSIEGKLSSELLSAITELEDRINSGKYNEKLEYLIPQSGLNLVSAEILYQLIKSTGSKISRNSIQQTLKIDKRISDKQQIVKEIFDILDFRN